MKEAVKWVVGAGKAASGAPQTEGLTPLDQDRAASLADEGGASAATVEAQPVDLDETPPLGFWPPLQKAK